jgi:hypothetical protein
MIHTARSLKVAPTATSRHTLRRDHTDALAERCNNAGSETCRMRRYAFQGADRRAVVLPCALCAHSQQVPWRSRQGWMRVKRLRARRLVQAAVGPH